MASVSAERFRQRTTYLGRDYQAYSLQHQINLVPVDDDEENRLQEQHTMLNDIFSDRKIPLVPDFVDPCIDILDCGYGTGIWAYEVAETFPECNVLGVDISPIMELGDMPENLDQEITDLNDAFTFAPSSFDFVHSQFVGAGISHARWPSYLTDVKKVLRSKGWIQLTEWEFSFRSENGNGERLSALRRWSEAYLSAISSGSGVGKKSRTVPDGLETMMRMSGFANVTADVRDIATCDWPLRPADKAVGRRNHENMRALIQSIALYPVTNRQIMSAADFSTLVSEARAELADETAKPYLRLHTIYGQKP